MGITFKGGLLVKAQIGLRRNLNAFVRRVTSIRENVLPEGIARGMLNGEYLPYEASQTYKAIKSELEIQRFRAIVEAHTQIFHQ